MTVQPTRTTSYSGVRAPTPPNLWTRSRDPAPQDHALYTIGDIWYNDQTLAFWILQDFVGTTLGPQADWILLMASAGGVAQLTGDSGAAVIPDGAGNINVLGGLNGILFSNGGANTLAAAVQVDGVTIGLNGLGQLEQLGVPGIFPWNLIAINTVGVVNNGYMANGVGQITLTLPAVFAFGDTIWIKDFGGNGVQVLPSVGDTVQFFNTSVGVSLTSTENTDAIQLVGSVANSRWDVISSQGNWDLV